MNIREITSGIHYCGVNDRTTALFEALWPLPWGVSYNSYIVRGSMHTALIDTVEIGELPEFLDHIDSLLQGASVDYLVVNHMEPDHSGSIPSIMNRYPGIRVVGNRQTAGMLAGYYGLKPEDIMIVDESSVIDLGGVTLRFVLTPMVHWPETMMTYVPERDVLFTGDAFGTFGALNGGIVDDETDTAVYIEEMYRYYACIVGKYGKFVQRALEKVAKLPPLGYICPTHGPVWHKEIERVSEIVDRLSRYEPEDGVVIVYGSMYGNTARVAERIASRLAQNGIRRIRVYNAATADISRIITDAFRYRGLVIGSATYSMRIFPPVEQVLAALETREVKNKVLATFGSCTWAPAAKTAIDGYAEKIGLPVVASLLMRQAPDATTYAEADALADTLAKALGC